MENQVTALALPDEVTFKRDIAAINNFQRTVRACMVEGQDFGVIPGTDKPSLLKPGAEKITKLLGLADKYELATQVEDWGKPFFHYVVKCTLISVASGSVISEGFGSCNSMESKYRWRDAKKKCPECGAEAIIKGKAEYGGGWICFAKKGGCGYKWPDGAEEIEKQKTGQVENDDIYSIVNTLMKMAEKRALVDAALHAGRLSQVFTQDIEDMPQFEGKAVVDGKGKVLEPETTKPADKPAAKELTPGQKLAAAMKEMGYSNDEVKTHMVKKYSKEHTKDLTPEQLAELTSDVRGCQVTRTQPLFKN
jgi:hypothetical protein